LLTLRLFFFEGGSLYTLMIGHEEESSVGHAARALELAQEVALMATELSVTSGIRLNLRMGVHSGSAVAGVTGSRPPRYIIAGSTIDLSSALERSCHPTCIQVSGTTRSLVEGTTAAKDFLFHKLHTTFNSDGDNTIESYVLNVGDWAQAVRETATEVAQKRSPAVPLLVESINEDNPQGEGSKEVHLTAEDGTRTPRATSTTLHSSEAAKELTASKSGLGNVTPCTHTLKVDAEERMRQQVAIHAPPSRSGRGLISCFLAPFVSE